MAGNILNIFDEFRNSSLDLLSRYPVSFDKLPENTVNKLRTYEEFLDYLAKEYLIKEGRQAGERPLYSTVISYMHKLFSLAKGRLATSVNAETKLFLTAMDKGATTAERRAMKVRGFGVAPSRAHFPRPLQHAPHTHTHTHLFTRACSLQVIEARVKSYMWSSQARRCNWQPSCTAWWWTAWHISSRSAAQPSQSRWPSTTNS